MFPNEFITFDLLIRILYINSDIPQSVLVLFNRLFHFKESLLDDILQKVFQIILYDHFNTVYLCSQAVIVFLYIEDL